MLYKLQTSKQQQWQMPTLRFSVRFLLAPLSSSSALSLSLRLFLRTNDVNPCPSTIANVVWLWPHVATEFNARSLDSVNYFYFISCFASIRIRFNTLDVGALLLLWRCEFTIYLIFFFRSHLCAKNKRLERPHFDFGSYAICMHMNGMILLNF